jgi:hypothetical protein
MLAAPEVNRLLSDVIVAVDDVVIADHTAAGGAELYETSNIKAIQLLITMAVVAVGHVFASLVQG